ncbi:Signal transduction histidine kinase [Lachnospiraceae bacterium XBB1006]|nr:Signal transduction histidine kinase [Lachnospiraceae bacterium XBB1006]
MKKTLLTKIFFGYVIFLFLAFFALKIYTFSHMRQVIQSDEAENLYSNAVSIAGSYGYRFFNEQITKENLHEYLLNASTFLNSDIWVVSTSGKVTGVSLDERTPAPNFIRNFDVTEMFNNSFYNLGTFHSYFQDEHLSVYAPITIKYNVCGYVILHKPCSSSAKLISHATRLTFQTALIIMASSTVVFWVLITRIIKPMKQLCKVADEFERENFKAKAIINGNDEISYISTVMNDMAYKLDTHEEAQRKFISNVSHDFKSPLTSIRGYIQAMLDGTIPLERHNKYLGIISNEADRLTNLTNNLLDLNRIGSQSSVLEKEDFNINQVIIDCARTCEVQCEKKGIALSLLLYEDTTIVHANKSKIQQVIYNLLDNAIKFSYRDSTITIETVERDEKLYVAIRDEGIGIPQEAIHSIWHRFYKTDLSRGKDRNGTGLGLSIVKEIIQAHNETISVESLIGVGSQFEFSLTLVKQDEDSAL